MDSRRDETYEESDCWKVIECYFSNQHLLQLVKHQVESYNDFIQNQMKRTIQMFNPLHIKSPHDYIKECKNYRLEVFIEFENLCIYRPEIHENVFREIGTNQTDWTITHYSENDSEINHIQM
jgi:DNA-directed RNA polymerase beta subunit